VLRESDRLNRIVSDFLTYARPPRMERTIVELVGLLSETMALLRNSPELKAEHRLVEKYPDHLVRYNGDPNQIRQVFWNLSRNAIQAMPLGGELRVSLQAKEGSDVIITFGDTGSGMSREQKERLFEPFNSSSGGTGLGMAIVYQLMRDHNGKVAVESEEGKGTRISIKLPASGRIKDEVVSSDAATRLNLDAPAVMANKL
jgi:two-component system sensor histidine kinase PilS (NtrC family)